MGEGERVKAKRLAWRSREPPIKIGLGAPGCSPDRQIIQSRGSVLHRLRDPASSAWPGRWNGGWRTGACPRVLLLLLLLLPLLFLLLLLLLCPTLPRRGGRGTKRGGPTGKVVKGFTSSGNRARRRTPLESNFVINRDKFLGG